MAEGRVTRIALEVLKSTFESDHGFDWVDYLETLFPKGAIWRPVKVDGDRFKMLQAIGDNIQAFFSDLGALAYLREPQLTTILNDLELEYGVLPSDSQTEQERRDYLDGVKYARSGTGSADYLQNALQQAGFAVQVHTNSPAVDPGAFYGGAGGMLIVNESEDDQADIEGARFRRIWNYTFFIGGNATRDADGRITAIAPVVLSSDDRIALAKIVLKHKPLHSWCVAVITDWDYFTFSSTTSWDYDPLLGFDGGFWFDETIQT
jgi:hypothetical protein